MMMMFFLRRVRGAQDCSRHKLKSIDTMGKEARLSKKTMMQYLVLVVKLCFRTYILYEIVFRRTAEYHGNLSLVLTYYFIVDHFLDSH